MEIVRKNYPYIKKLLKILDHKQQINFLKLYGVF